MGEPQVLRDAAGPALVAVARWARGHVPWVAFLTVAAASILKVVAVARGDYATAAVLISTASIPAVVLGTIVVMLPGTLAVSFMALVYATIRHLRRVHRTLPIPSEQKADQFRRVVRLSSCALAAGLVGAGLVTLTPVVFPILALIGCLVVNPAVALIHRSTAGDDTKDTRFDRWARRHWRAAVGCIAVIFAVGAGVAGGLLMAPVFSDRAWLPAYAVARPGESPWTAYLVRDQGGSAVFLRDRDRTVVSLPSEYAANATVCLTDDMLAFQTLWQAVRGVSGPATPRCPAR